MVVLARAVIGLLLFPLLLGAGLLCFIVLPWWLFVPALGLGWLMRPVRGQ